MEISNMSPLKMTYYSLLLPDFKTLNMAELYN